MSETSGFVQFVIANVGAAPGWIDTGEYFDFWKNEAKPRLSNGAQASLGEFPGGYCYFASQWEAETAPPIVLLEKHY